MRYLLIILTLTLVQALYALPYNSIQNIDGIVDGEWTVDELTVDDPNDDSGWDSDLNEIDDVYLTWDAMYLYVGLIGYTESFNAVHIAIDVDPGAGIGEKDFSTGYVECLQNCRSVEEGFGAEFMYASDGMEAGEIYSLNWIDASETQMDAITAAHAIEPKGYEIRVRWDSLFGLGEGMVPESCKIAIVAILGNAAGDYCSSETAPDWINGSYSDGDLLFDKSYTIVIDSDGDAIPDDLTQSVFLLEDPVADDYGPGTYEYPLAPVFTQGSFDLISFEVFRSSQRVHFILGISGELEDPWGSGAGFSLQNLDVYIDKDGIEGSGATHTLEGRNASISPTSAWEQLVWCAPPFDNFRSCLIDPDGVQDTSGVVVIVDTVKDEISISVPVEKIGEPDTSWAYIVLMLSQDGFSPGRVRWVNMERDQWIFGGGDDGNYDSNIIDMILLPGLSQEGMLGNYDPDLGVQPILYARPDTISPTIIHTPVIAVEEHLPVEIMAEVIDNIVSQANIYFRTIGEEWYLESPMSRYSGDIWRGEIPGEAVSLDGLEYWLYATDGMNSSTSPSDTSSPYQVEVTPDITPPSILDVCANPDPFSPNGDGYQDTTLLTWTLTEPANATVTVYDSSLQVQRVLLASQLSSSGTHSTVWNGRNDAGEIVPNGIYSIRFEGTDLSGHPAEPVEITAAVDTLSERKLDLIFLFHFNQNLVPYSKVANTACYVGLLETLRAHPKSKFLIHISGSLIHDLLWFDDRAIQLIKEGIVDGQFEILGSTYIQNVMYSTRIDTLDFQFNDEQIKLHKALIERVFGVSPKGFWNPERTWTQNFVQLLADNGYEWVQVEDHILLESGITGSEYLVRTTSYNGRELIVFDDDKTFEGWVNYVIDSGDYMGLINFLHQLYEEDSTNQYAVCYHEDAEASGLWDYEGGENPEVDWTHLDNLLTLLENDPLFKITTYGDWLQNHESAEEVTPIVDGAASWMGGDSWFAENNSENMNSYRIFFDGIRNRLNQVEEMIENSEDDTSAASRLLNHAWSTLCAHQYEFGCHGLTEHSGFTDWDLARCALVGAQAAEYALGPITTTYQDDINDDSIDEIIMVIPSDMWVFSPYGGRLLYWFDLERGEELIGDENFMYYGENYISDNLWVPPLQGGVDIYTWLSGNHIFPEIFEWNFEIRRRALNDWIEVNGASIGRLVNEPYAINLQNDHVEFSFSSSQLNLTKTISLQISVPEVSYILTNPTADSINLVLRSENAFCPSYLDVMNVGRESLKFWNGQTISDSADSSTIGVINTRTGSRIVYEFLSSPTSLTGEEVVFGLELNPIYNLPLPGYQSGSISYRLRKHLNNPPNPFSLIYPVDSSSVNLPVILSWEAAQDPDTDAIMYDLYLSTDPAFTETTTTIFSGIQQEQFLLDSLQFNTYYWKVKARDPWDGLRWSREVWSFLWGDASPFIRGDANADSALGISDAIDILRYMFIPGTPPPPCMDACDTNDDGNIFISDPLHLLRYLFVPGSPSPPPPFPDCGVDSTPDSLACGHHPCSNEPIFRGVPSHLMR